MRNELKKRMELERMVSWKTRLEEFESGHLPFMCLQYKDKDSVQHTIPAVFIGSLSSFADQKIVSLVSESAVYSCMSNAEGKSYTVTSLLFLFSSIWW